MRATAVSNNNLIRYGLAGCMLICLRSVLSQEGGESGVPGPDGAVPPDGPMDPINNPTNDNQLPPRNNNAQYEVIFLCNFFVVYHSEIAIFLFFLIKIYRLFQF